jgi:hypothetical protein
MPEEPFRPNANAIIEALKPQEEQRSNRPTNREAFVAALNEPQVPRERSTVERIGRIAGMLPAGFNEAVYNTAGMPVDLATGILNLPSRAARLAGYEAPLIENPAFGSDWIKTQLGRVDPGLNPSNIQPEDNYEAFARGAGSGAGSALTMAGQVYGLGRAGLERLAPQAYNIASRAFGNLAPGTTAANVALSAPATGAGEITERTIRRAEDENPEQGGASWAPLARMATEILTGGTAAGGYNAARATTQAGREYLRPFTQSGRNAGAAQTIYENSSDPNAVKQRLARLRQQLVPDSEPTTAQVAEDPNLLQFERSVAGQALVMGDQSFEAVRRAQNAARIEALNNIQTTGDPRDVSKFIRNQFDEIDQQEMAAVERARTEAADRASKVGGELTPEDYGASIRNSLEDAAESARENRNKLYDAIDPERNLNVVSSSVRTKANEIYDNLGPMAQQPEGAENTIRELTRNLEDVTSFQNLRDLDTNITDAMSNEMRTNGRSAAWGRLSQLKGAVASSIDNAVENQTAHESARPPNAGGPQLTMEQRLRQVWGLEPPPAQTLTPNMTDEASAALDEAKKAHAAYVQTFQQGPVGAVLRTGGFRGQYTIPDPNVAMRMFVPGQAGYDRAMAFRNAVGDDAAAVGVMQDYATMSMLRAARGADGVIDPAKFERWATQHQDALRAFPEISRRFSGAIEASNVAAEMAARQAEVTQRNSRNSLAQFINRDNPDAVNVTAEVGNILNKRNSGQLMGELASAVSNNPEARDGLRRAVANHITETYVSPTFGENVNNLNSAQIYGARLQRFLRQNQLALSHVFSRDELNSINNIAADIRRSDMSLNSTRMPGQSNTTVDMLTQSRQDTNNRSKFEFFRTLHARALSGFGTGLGFGYQVGSPMLGGIIGGTLGALYHPIALAREAGITSMHGLIREAMLNPDLANSLLQRNPIRPNTGSDIDLSRALARMSVYSGIGAEANEPERGYEVRATRASGGRITSHHRAKAQALINAADRAKKAHNGTTKPILDMPDETVAKALSLADQAI